MRIFGLKIVMLFTVLLAGSASASTLDHNFQQGNQYYKDGDYAGAVTEYSKIIIAGYESPQLYYNLGNAHFRNGELGMAIVNYIRARRLAPRDDDIRANLEFAHQYAIDKIEVTEETIILDYVNRFFDSFSVNEITIITMIIYVLTVLMILAGIVYQKIRIVTPIIITVVLILGISTIMTVIKLDRDVLTRTGVVLQSQVEVKNGPGEDFSNQFTAHSGLTFKIEREEAGYYLVNFENRLKGWIQLAAVAEI